MTRAAALIPTCLVSLCLGPMAVAEESCVDLSMHTLASLERYSFEGSSEEALQALDGRRAYRVGELRIVRQTIFDPTNPEENGRFQRAVDRLHIDTRESVVRQLLLFEEDSSVDVATLAESERLLRAKPYLYDARVLPRRVCGDRVDVDVVTRDVWSLNPRLDFSREGGDSAFDIGLTDANLLGRGREISFGYASDEDREGFDASYYDPNVSGSRVSLFVFAADNDDGSRQYLDVGQPFYSLDARASLGSRVDILDQEEGLYFRGDETSEFRRRMDDYSLSGGVSAGRGNGGVWRWLAGYRYEDHRFSPLSGIVAPDPFPEDRTIAYPWIGFEHLEDEFETAVNLDRIERTEDVYLGRRYYGHFGYSSDAWGGDSVERGVFRTGVQDGFRPNERTLWRVAFDATGYYNFDLDRVEDTVMRATASYRHHQNERFSFAGDARGVFTKRLYADHQLLLGGDSGMRGYPSRYQAGDRSFVVSLEERYFTNVYLWRLIRVGYALFVDVGRAWFPDEPSDDEYGVLADVGFGLRLESPRLRGDQVVHIDFGFPLVDGEEVDTVQVSFTIKSQL
jgi:hypothetical protein